MTLIADVRRGKTVTVDATALNIGENSGTQTITLDKNSTQVDSVSGVDVASGASDDTVSLLWDTSGETLQTYTLKVSSDDDTATRNVRVFDEVFGVTITSTNSPVVAGATLTVTVDVSNTGNEPGTTFVSLDVGGQTRDSTSQQVDGGKTKTVTLEWDTEDGDVGNYTATVDVANDSASTSVTVSPTLTDGVPTGTDNHWPFDAGSGDVVTDDPGSFNADFGTAISWASNGDGKGGTYGKLDGSGGADLGGSSDSHWSHWVNSGVGAIGGWINPDFAAQPDPRAGILASDIEGGGPNDNTIGLYYTDGGQLEFVMEADGTGTEVDPSVIQDRTWQAVAVRADGSTVRLYHATVGDASLSEVASASVAATASGDLSKTVQMGQDDPNFADRYAAGGIDDLWSDQSDPGEQAIKDWYNATKGNYS